MQPRYGSRDCRNSIHSRHPQPQQSTSIPRMRRPSGPSRARFIPDLYCGKGPCFAENRASPARLDWVHPDPRQVQEAPLSLLADKLCGRGRAAVHKVVLEELKEDCHIGGGRGGTEGEPDCSRGAPLQQVMVVPANFASLEVLLQPQRRLTS